MDHSRPQQDIHEVHCHMLAEVLRFYNFEYELCAMKVYSTSAVCPAGATDATAVRDVRGIKYLKDSYYIDMIDGHYRHRSVKMPGDENAFSRITEPLRLRYTFRQGREVIRPAQAKKLSQIANIWTLAVQWDATIADNI